MIFWFVLEDKDSSWVEFKFCSIRRYHLKIYKILDNLSVNQIKEKVIVYNLDIGFLLISMQKSLGKMESY